MRGKPRLNKHTLLSDVLAADWCKCVVALARRYFAGLSKHQTLCQLSEKRGICSQENRKTWTTRTVEAGWLPDVKILKKKMVGIGTRTYLMQTTSLFKT